MFKLSDGLYDEKEVEFFSKKEGYDTLSRFERNISSSSEFAYYHAISQPIYVMDFKGGPIFDPLYERGGQRPPIERNNKVYSAVKSMQLNKTAFELNELRLKTGSGFTDKDYIYTEKQNEFPILLGAAFSHVYELGDQIEFNVYKKDLIGTVIGFFEPTQKVMTAFDPEIQIDRYIILPSWYYEKFSSLVMKKEDELFFMASLLNLVNGTIVTDLSPLEARRVVNKIGKEVGFTDFQLIGANSLAIDALIGMTEMNRTYLLVSTCLMFVMTMMLFLYVTITKIRKNIDIFKVLLISGVNSKQIYQYVRYELLLTCFMGSSLSILVLFMLMDDPFMFFVNYLFVIIAIIAGMVLIVNMFIVRTFKEIDLVQKLKG